MLCPPVFFEREGDFCEETEYFASAHKDPLSADCRKSMAFVRLFALRGWSYFSDCILLNFNDAFIHGLLNYEAVRIFCAWVSESRT